MRWPGIRKTVGVGIVLLAITLLASGCSKKSSSGGGLQPGTPRIMQVSPDSGGTAGGEVVTISTADFQDDFTMVVPLVFFDAILLNGTPLDSGMVTVVTPAHPVGAVDVRVIGTGVAESAVLPAGFTYTAPPTCDLCTVFPNWGPPQGRDVTIAGDFDPGPLGLFEVSFGSVQGTVISADATTIVATAPAAAVGSVDVTVKDAGGRTCVCSSCFTYKSGGCVITTVTGITGGTNGGAAVRIDGTDYDVQGVDVLFGGIFADPNTITVDPSGNIIWCVAPPSPTGGPKPVEVRSLVSGLDCISQGAFDYVLPGGGVCTIVDVSPTSGPAGGGQAVTISGSGFDANTGVLFGMRPATAVNFINSTTIEVVTPALAGSLCPAVDVVVAPEFRDPCVVPKGFTYN